MKMLKNKITSLLMATFIVAGGIFVWSCDDDEKTTNGIVPKATSITPNENVKAGTVVTITGTELNHVKAVRFGTQCLVVKVDFDEASNATQIVLTLPAEAPNGEVYLVAEDETVPNQLAGTITVVMPVVTDIAPLEVTGGSVITITGTDVDLVAEVYIATVELTDLNLVSETELQATCPRNIAGGFLKLVTKADEEVQYTAKSFASIIPTITNVTPTTVATGTVITITGTKLLAVEKVLIAGTELVEITPISDTELTAKCPSGLESGELKVITYNGEEVVYGASAITVNPSPVADEVSNTVVKGGVVVTGTDLNLVTAITVGGAQVTNFLSQSSTQIIFDLPATVGAGNTTLGLIHSGGTVTSPEFEVSEFTPIVFFPFIDPATEWSNDGFGSGAAHDLGNVVAGSAGHEWVYFVDETVDGSWKAYFMNNGQWTNESNPFSTSTLSSADVVKMDVKIDEVGEAVVLKFRMTGDAGDFWYVWKIGELYSSVAPTGWITVSFPLADFKDNNGDGPGTLNNPIGQIPHSSGTNDVEYGLTAGWGSGKITLSVDNVRFDHP
jgi:hypothetical protein